MVEKLKYVDLFPLRELDILKMKIVCSVHPGFPPEKDAKPDCKADFRL
jgi:hypothetical protein